MKALRTSSALIAAAITFAACAGDDSVSTETVNAPVAPASPATPADPTPADPAPAAPTGEVGPPSQPAAPADVPSVDVSRIPSGEAVNLQTLAQGNDTLFWFWAPH